MKNGLLTFLLMVLSSVCSCGLEHMMGHASVQCKKSIVISQHVPKKIPSSLFKSFPFSSVDRNGVLAPPPHILMFLLFVLLVRLGLHCILK